MNQTNSKIFAAFLTRTLLTLALFLWSTSVVFSKNNRTNSHDSTWTLGKQQDSVNCYYKIVTCGSVQQLLLSFENTGSTNATITWEEEFTTQYDSAATGFYGSKTLTVNGGSETTGACNDGTVTCTSSYAIRPDYHAQIQAFRFINLSVTR